jgi:hypothetical protein
LRLKKLSLDTLDDITNRYIDRDIAFEGSQKRRYGQCRKGYLDV